MFLAIAFTTIIWLVATLVFSVQGSSLPSPQPSFYYPVNFGTPQSIFQYYSYAWKTTVPDNEEFISRSIEVQFLVQCTTDAQVVITNCGGCVQPTNALQFILGGWGNQMSAVRLGYENANMAFQVNDAPCDGNNYLPLWLTVDYDHASNTGTLSTGKGNLEEQVLTTVSVPNFSNYINPTAAWYVGFGAYKYATFYALVIVAGNTQTLSPSISPTSSKPSKSPSRTPSKTPSRAPSRSPSRIPSRTPSRAPSHSPSNFPTKAPSNSPSSSPIIFEPSTLGKPHAAMMVSSTGTMTVTPTVSPLANVFALDANTVHLESFGASGIILQQTDHSSFCITVDDLYVVTWSITWLGSNGDRTHLINHFNSKNPSSQQTLLAAISSTDLESSKSGSVFVHLSVGDCVRITAQVLPSSNPLTSPNQQTATMTGKLGTPLSFGLANFGSTTVSRSWATTTLSSFQVGAVTQGTLPIKTSLVSPTADDRLAVMASTIKMTSRYTENALYSWSLVATGDVGGVTQVNGVGNSYTRYGIADAQTFMMSTKPGQDMSVMVDFAQGSKFASSGSSFSVVLVASPSIYLHSSPSSSAVQLTTNSHTPTELSPVLLLVRDAGEDSGPDNGGSYLTSKASVPGRIKVLSTGVFYVTVCMRWTTPATSFFAGITEAFASAVDTVQDSSTWVAYALVPNSDTSMCGSGFVSAQAGQEFAVFARYTDSTSSAESTIFSDQAANSQFSMTFMFATTPIPTPSPVLHTPTYSLTFIGTESPHVVTAPPTTSNSNPSSSPVKYISGSGDPHYQWLDLFSQESKWFDCHVHGWITLASSQNWLVEVKHVPFASTTFMTVIEDVRVTSITPSADPLQFDTSSWQVWNGTEAAFTVQVQSSDWKDTATVSGVDFKLVVQRYKYFSVQQVMSVFMFTNVAQGGMLAMPTCPGGKVTIIQEGSVGNNRHRRDLENAVLVPYENYSVTTFSNGTQLIQVESNAACDSADFTGNFRLQCIVDVGISKHTEFLNATLDTQTQHSSALASAMEMQQTVVDVHAKSGAFATHGKFTVMVVLVMATLRLM